ncbi:MAG: type II toxin-antitoxin system PemK/MazF family toxin [Planctomycetota bacterium]
MAERRSVAYPGRGEVYLVNFDSPVGAEIQKTRPAALILQNDIGNRCSPVTIVAAISSQLGERLYPTEVLIKPGEAGLKKPSAVLLTQIRTIDKVRLTKRLGAVTRSDDGPRQPCPRAEPRSH